MRCATKGMEVGFTVDVEDETKAAIGYVELRSLEDIAD
jgi:hypothetical protein